MNNLRDFWMDIFFFFFFVTERNMIRMTFWNDKREPFGKNTVLNRIYIDHLDQLIGRKNHPKHVILNNLLFFFWSRHSNIKNSDFFFTDH